MSLRYLLIGIALFYLVFAPGPATAAHTIEAGKVKAPPTIDGIDNEATWRDARSFTIRDERLGVDIHLKAAYTDDSIFFLVRFPDQTEDRLHKPWVWNKALEVYEIGPQREDTFTFKWNMADGTVDLSNFSDDDYTADVWYWKANRTDPAGFADDKMHILSSEAAKKSNSLVSAKGRQRYLLRLGDKGAAAQKKRILTDYQGDVQDQFTSQTPDGSRGDIRAKGAWSKGEWTVEFARKLQTGHDDDVQFDASPGKSYLFGISIAGLYGEDVDPSKPHPYGQGRISDPLYLKFR
ncbi:MAG: hypothetical protein JSV26_01365 [bacterium]|nr:MAG: hypothetical protein JSV26_01365 [bacterium]